MWGAEQADRLTWAGIWSACKEAVQKRGMKPIHKGYFDAVSELFEDVIYKTQVVDSVLTKNEYMRSKGFLARTTSSFMSEPVTNASMLIDAYDKLRMDMQKGMDFSRAWRRNKKNIGRTAYVYGLGAAVLAAVTAVLDAWRDDDEYETFLEKWSEAFNGNLIDELNPLGKLPLVKEVSEFVKELAAAGWKLDVYGQMSNLPYIDMAEQFLKGVEILSDKINGVDTNYTWYGGIYKLLQGVSGISGLPMATTTREIITAWNNIVGRMVPSLRVMSYESSADETAAALLEAFIGGNQKEVDRISAKFEDEAAMHSGLRSAVKKLYMSGDVDQMTARKYLMLYADMDLNDTYWALREWDHVQETGSSDDYSKYGKFYEAVETGKNLDAVIREYTENGVDEQTLRGQITDHFKPIYLDMPAYEKKKLKARLLDALVANGSFLADAEDIISEWDFEAKHGHSYDEMVADYKNGVFSVEEMNAILINRGLTAEEAEDRMSGWDFEVQYGFSYSSREKAYKEGKISAADLRTAMIEFGDMTETEANNYIRAYDWQIENPQYNLTVSDVLSYTKPIEALGYSVEDSDISPNVYVEYKNKVSKCKGEDEDGDGRADNNTVKNQKMGVINELPLSDEQKDVLYYLNGWAKSKIYKAPWH